MRDGVLAERRNRRDEAFDKIGIARNALSAPDVPTLGGHNGEIGPFRSVFRRENDDRFRNFDPF